jgi:AraC-like DNA-binding protein
LEKPLILGSGVSARIRNHLIDVAAATTELVICQSFAAVRHRATDDARRTIAIVLGAIDADGVEAVPLIRDLTAMQLGVPIIAVCHGGNQHSSEIRKVAAAGAHELLFDDTDDAASAIRDLLQSASHECAADVVGRRLRPLIPARLHPFVDFCLAHASSESLAYIAHNLGVHRATISRHCEVEGMPPPMELYAWCRLMLAAYFLERPVLTVETIAMETDFPSVNSLHNMLRRYVGLRASEVRARGGLSCVIDRFVAAHPPRVIDPDATRSRQA